MRLMNDIQFLKS